VIALLLNPFFMLKQIPITDLDFIRGPEEITVRRISDADFSKLYLKNVIDLASIIGTHQGIPQDAYLYEFLPA
jgi:hypothetical protein